MKLNICAACVLAGMLLSGCPGSTAVLVPGEAKKPPRFQQTFASDEPYQVVYKRILERCFGWTPGRNWIAGRPFINHEVFSDLKEAVICRSLNEDFATMVTWKIAITATESGGCTVDVSAVNNDHW